MVESIAYCGLLCNGCPLYWATIEQDVNNKLKMKQVIQQICKQQYGKEVELEEITDCFGCTTENKPLFVGCMSCEIRACARKKNVENCAHCPDYACETLNQFLLKNSESKARLDVIKSIV